MQTYHVCAKRKVQKVIRAAKREQPKGGARDGEESRDTAVCTRSSWDCNGCGDERYSTCPRSSLSLDDSPPTLCITLHSPELRLLPEPRYLRYGSSSSTALRSQTLVLRTGCLCRVGLTSKRGRHGTRSWTLPILQWQPRPASSGFRLRKIFPKSRSCGRVLAVLRQGAPS